MNQNELMAMAREAGFEVTEHAIKATNVFGEIDEELARFAALVAAKEREAWRASLEPAFRGRMGSEQVREIVQSAIRARGQKEGV